MIKIWIFDIFMEYVFSQPYWTVSGFPSVQRLINTEITDSKIEFVTAGVAGAGK